MKPAAELRSLKEARDRELHAIAVELRVLKRNASPKRMIRTHLGAAMITAGILGLILAPRTGRQAGRGGIASLMRALVWLSRGIVQRSRALNQLEKLTSAVRKGWIDSIFELLPGLFQGLMVGINAGRFEKAVSAEKECAPNGRHTWGAEQAEQPDSTRG